ncbi:PilW family protein [Marinobacter sp. S0848L]|nr:PilW family protein [Marinobacter sp. S0848L]
MIADCENVDIFRLSEDPTGTPVELKHAGSTNTNGQLSVVYAADEDAALYSLESTVFFVADTGRVDGQGNSISALYRATNNFPNSATPSFQREELVEGVEAMKIQYGIRTSANNNTINYVDASAVGANDWRDVVVVRVGLLVSASGSALGQNDTQTYQLPGTVFVASSPGTGEQLHAADRRLRKTFVSTIDIRNRRCGEFKQLGATGQWEWESADENGGDGDPCN